MAYRKGVLKTDGLRVEVMSLWLLKRIYDAVDIDTLRLVSVERALIGRREEYLDD